MKFIIAIIACFFSSCTYNVSMAHTSGTATDVIDDTASNSPNVSPVVNIPVTPGSAMGLPK